MPRSLRWLAGGVAAVVLALAVSWVLFVPTADWLAHHDVGSATGSLHETALDNARGRLLTLGAGLFAAGALVFTARNFTLSREGQVTDRYTKAIEQLGSKELDVRIGGIYALERVARDSARDHPTVVEVLTAFIREHSHEQWPPSDDPVGRSQEQSTRPDVQAALTVLGRRDAHRDIRSIDLTGAILSGANLDGADLARALLRGADLARASLVGADLTGARLRDADLTSASLVGADLTDAILEGAKLARAILARANLSGAFLIIGADLTGAILNGAILNGADLDGADLTSASLDRADLTGASLVGADLTSADLTGAILNGAFLNGTNLGGAILDGADLTGANLDGTNLSGAILDGADLTGAMWWPRDAPVPEGWRLDPSSGRLNRASTGSGPTEAN